MGVTINTVMLNPAMRPVLYATIVIACITGLLFFLHAQNRFLQALKKSLLVSFFASGLLYAVHADIGWTTWIIRDIRAFAGRTTDEKLLNMEGRYYDFVRLSKKYLPDTYMLYSSNSYLALRSEYFFLPARKRENADVIVVLADNEARYDSAQRTLTRGTVRYTNVEPLLLYLPDAYVVKKQ